MKKILNVFLTLLLLGTTQSCGLYTFSGASIPPEMKTIVITFFDNTTPLAPTYVSQQFTTSLIDVVQSQTRLRIIPSDGDATLEGKIVDYRIDPVAIQSDNQSQTSKLTIKVNVKYTNYSKPELSFEENFQGEQQFSVSQQTFDTQQQNLVTIINGYIIDKVFNRTFANW